MSRGKSMRRAKRRHHIKRIANARRRFVTWGRVSDNELATRHPNDCGSRCLLCHGEKLLGAGRRRRRENREALAMAEADLAAGVEVLPEWDEEAA